jgi:hypothetical protein
VADEEHETRSRYRSSFDLFLRTGLKFRHPAGDRVEVKFNPWHDPDDGRFTFANQGNHFAKGAGQLGGGGSFGGGGATSRERWPIDDPKGSPQGQRSGTSGTRSKPPFRPNSYGKGDEKHGRPVDAPLTRVFQRADKPAPLRVESKNGYRYGIDPSSRTLRVRGIVTADKPTEARSKQAQAQAGGSDRLKTDDGGHFVAHRLNGPRDAYNHFAQDRNFNRSAYAKFENEIAKAATAGKKVVIEIDAVYEGASKRPSIIYVVYEIDGKRTSRLFPNSSGKSR